MKELTLIIPAKKEAESLPTFLREIENIDCHKMVVLQKEDTETKNVLRNFHGIEIFEQINNGYGNALIEGINNSKTKFSCIINADGSMDPKYLNSMLENCVTKDFIFASRYEKKAGSEDDTIITYVGNRIFSFIGKIFFSLPLNDILYTFVIGRTLQTKKLSLKQKDFSFCVELPIKACKSGYKLVTSKSNERARIGGRKKVNALKDGLLILISMFKLFFKVKK